MRIYVVLVIVSRIPRAFSWCTSCEGIRCHQDRGPAAPSLSLLRLGDGMQSTEVSSTSDLECMARDFATKALEPVLMSKPQASETDSAERALKHTLRALSTDLTQSQRRWMRARLSTLILGTSVMRLYHEYVWNSTAATLPAFSDDSSAMIRAMVDSHAAYIDNSNKSSSFVEIIWPVETTKRLSVRYSLPPFLVESLVKQYGPRETDLLCRVFNEPGPITLRVNSLECPSRQALMERLEQEEELVAEPLSTVFLDNTSMWKPPLSSLRLPCRPHKRSIWSMPSWKDGWFEVQDVGSQLIVLATEAKAGEIVVDYCAGNGGKTLAIASLTQQYTSESACNNNTIIWAHDVVEQRLAQLRGSLQRTGVSEHSNIRIHKTTSFNETIGMADVVLVDAPCSSSGVLRRRPSHRWTMTEQDVRFTFPELQLELLQRASRLVKPRGGRLVYATCSVLKCENQDVVEAWEKCCKSMDYSSWQPWDFDEQEWPLQEGVAPHFRALIPHVHNSDGFFIARWKRN